MQKKVAESTKTSAGMQISKNRRGKSTFEKWYNRNDESDDQGFEDAMKTLVARGDVKELKALIDTYEKEELKRQIIQLLHGVLMRQP